MAKQHKTKTGDTAVRIDTSAAAVFCTLPPLPLAEIRLVAPWLASRRKITDIASLYDSFSQCDIEQDLVHIAERDYDIELF